MKKYSIYLLPVIAMLMFTRCDSLDLESESVITDGNYWKTASHFNAFNVGLYSKIRESGYNFFLLGEPRANLFLEDMPFGGESPQGVERLPYNTLNRENVGISDFASLYQRINQVNLMIDKATETNVLTDIEKNFYLGEAYGLRAFMYFHLLRSWGDVIIHLDGTEGGKLDIFNLAKAASPATEVMAQIKSDISASESAFGNDNSFKKGRHYWSLPATLMLKGEVYLWSGKQMGGGATDYQTAKTAFQQVANADVALLDNFEAVFAFSNKKNKEIIFAFHNGKDEYTMLGGGYGNFLPQDAYINLYYDENGVNFGDYAAADKIRGLIRFQINFDFYHKGYYDDDPRKRSTLKAAHQKGEDGELKYIAPFANKFKGTLVEGSSSCSLLDDYPIYRYADCLLQLAMAKALLGEDISTEINLIRERAYGADYFNANRSRLAYPNDTDADFYADNKYGASDADPLEAILKERLREFMFEGKRWYDLRLLGDPYIYKYSHAEASRLLWPINETALTNNPLLVQTTGY